MRSKPPSIAAGQGELKFTGFSGPVAYRIEGEPRSLRAGHLRLRGSITTAADVAAAAFRAGDGELALEDGQRLRITMQALTAGSDEIFVELRV